MNSNGIQFLPDEYNARENKEPKERPKKDQCDERISIDCNDHDFSYCSPPLFLQFLFFIDIFPQRGNAKNKQNNNKRVHNPRKKHHASAAKTHHVIIVHHKNTPPFFYYTSFSTFFQFT